MKWCCIGFKAGYESAGERGKAYLIGRDSLGDPEFLIQYRAVDMGQEVQIDSEVPVSIIIDCRILFCPSCGANLERFYKTNIDALRREGFELGLIKES